MIEIKRNDEQFNLDNIDNKTIFEGIKDGIASSAKTLNNFKSCDNLQIDFEDDHSTRKQTFGVDGNLYPHIHLSTTLSNPHERFSYVNAIVVVTPFGGKMVVYGQNAQLQTIETEDLQNSVQTFMQNTFPDSDYAEKLQKYNRAAQIKTRIYDEMVFGK